MPHNHGLPALVRAFGDLKDQFIATGRYQPQTVVAVRLDDGFLTIIARRFAASEQRRIEWLRCHRRSKLPMEFRGSDWKLIKKSNQLILS
jgi:hypothetical protein